MRSWTAVILALLVCWSPNPARSAPPAAVVSLPHFREAVEEILREDDRRVALHRGGLEEQDVRSYVIDVCIDPERSWFYVVATVEVACGRGNVRLAVHPSVSILSLIHI